MGHPICHLLGSLEGYVNDLRSATDISREKFLTDIRSQRFVERTLHMAIECCCKVVRHIISEEGLRSPASCEDALTLLAEKGIIRWRSVPEYRMMAEFRDKVMKSIENADREQAFGLFQNKLDVFERFGVEIQEFFKNRTGQGADA